MDPISNYKFINDKINSLAKNVTLIVVTKTFTMNVIKPLIDLGHLHFGENKVQEVSAKWTDVLKVNKNLKLHMLGKIQSNKVDLIVQIFSFIHSLDSEKLANKFYESETKTSKKLNYFIQVNIGNESQKGGVNLNVLTDFVKFCKFELKLNILGLMCIPPFDSKPDFFFNKLKELNDSFNFKDLSMGMSSDYESAIKHGSNYIRIGSLIFGKRV
jgi:pyridoxal phosphate enzyme (YggS family)